MRHCSVRTHQQLVHPMDHSVCMDDSFKSRKLNLKKKKKDLTWTNKASQEIEQSLTLFLGLPSWQAFSCRKNHSAVLPKDTLTCLNEALIENKFFLELRRIINHFLSSPVWYQFIKEQFELQRAYEPWKSIFEGTVENIFIYIYWGSTKLLYQKGWKSDQTLSCGYNIENQQSKFIFIVVFINAIPIFKVSK